MYKYIIYINPLFLSFITLPVSNDKDATDPLLLLQGWDFSRRDSLANDAPGTSSVGLAKYVSFTLNPPHSEKVASSFAQNVVDPSATTFLLISELYIYQRVLFRVAAFYPLRKNHTRNLKRVNSPLRGKERCEKCIPIKFLLCKCRRVLK